VERRRYPFGVVPSPQPKKLLCGPYLLGAPKVHGRKVETKGDVKHGEKGGGTE